MAFNPKDGKGGGSAPKAPAPKGAGTPGIRVATTPATPSPTPAQPGATPPVVNVPGGAPTPSLSTDTDIGGPTLVAGSSEGPILETEEAKEAAAKKAAKDISFTSGGGETINLGAGGEPKSTAEFEGGKTEEEKKKEEKKRKTDREPWEKGKEHEKLDMTDWLQVFRGLFGGTFGAVDYAVTGIAPSAGKGALKTVGGTLALSGGFIGKGLVKAADFVTLGKFKLTEKAAPHLNKLIDFGSSYCREGLNQATGWGTPIVGLTKLAMGAATGVMGVLSGVKTAAKCVAGLRHGTEGVKKAWKEGRGLETLKEAGIGIAKGLDDMALGLPRLGYDKLTGQGPYGSKDAPKETPKEGPKDTPKGAAPKDTPKDTPKGAPEPKQTPKDAPKQDETNPLIDRAKKAGDDTKAAQADGRTVPPNPKQPTIPADQLTPQSDAAAARAATVPLVPPAPALPTPAPGTIPAPAPGTQPVTPPEAPKTSPTRHGL